jgi:hypothetical protein
MQYLYENTAYGSQKQGKNTVGTVFSLYAQALETGALPGANDLTRDNKLSSAGPRHCGSFLQHMTVTVSRKLDPARGRDTATVLIMHGIS